MFSKKRSDVEPKEGEFLVRLFDPTKDLISAVRLAIGMDCEDGNPIEEFYEELMLEIIEMLEPNVVPLRADGKLASREALYRFRQDAGWEVKVNTRRNGDVLELLRMRAGFNFPELLVQRFNFLNPILLCDEAREATCVPTEVWRVTLLDDDFDEEADEMDINELKSNSFVFRETKTPAGVLKF